MKKIHFFFCVLLSFNGMSQTVSSYIIIDQFGYTPNAQKTAVLRNPEIGFDAAENYSPGATYAVVDASTCLQVFTGSAAIWSNGKTDSVSGDKAWWFDFSAVTTPGIYYILDVDHSLRSHSFEIRDNIYSIPLKHAVRTFYYQRSGAAKITPYAESGWIDGVNHVGPLQDKNCRSYTAPNDISTERDVHGGWFDAGDYNKYTNWTGNYIIEMLKAYEENPTVWTDDYNLPESGNGIPDLLDEVKWGMDYLLRLQKTDGSVISLVGASHASPPSATTGKSIYGGVNTSSALKAAATYAFGYRVFKAIGLTAYADTLKTAAIKAWNWADANPSVIWANTDAAYQSVSPSSSANSEVGNYERIIYKLEAAVYLFDISADSKYKTYFDNNYTQSHLYQWYYAYPYEAGYQDVLLQYTKLSGATTAVANTIKSRYSTGMNAAISFGAYDSKKDPYMTYIDSYTWGSNSIKCNQGNMFFNVSTYNINAARNTDAVKAAENFIHYIHGVNPLGKVYLSNMNNYGAENSVDEFYHGWFAHGSSKWDKVGVSTYGPPPGFLVGGPNPSYKVHSCCPNNCGDATNNALCSSVNLSRIINQPSQKSYMDFNNGWPIDSWEVTENSCGYQVAYIRLLSKFTVNNSNSSPNEASCTTSVPEEKSFDFSLYPNPSETSFTIQAKGTFSVKVISLEGKLIDSFEGKSTLSFGSNLAAGCYFVQVYSRDLSETRKIIKY